MVHLCKCGKPSTTGCQLHNEFCSILLFQQQFQVNSHSKTNNVLITIILFTNSPSTLDITFPISYLRATICDLCTKWGICTSESTPIENVNMNEAQKKNDDAVENEHNPSQPTHSIINNNSGDATSSKIIALRPNQLVELSELSTVPENNPSNSQPLSQEDNDEINKNASTIYSKIERTYSTSLNLAANANNASNECIATIENTYDIHSTLPITRETIDTTSPTHLSNTSSLPLKTEDLHGTMKTVHLII